MCFKSSAMSSITHQQHAGVRAAGVFESSACAPSSNAPAFSCCFALTTASCGSKCAQWALHFFSKTSVDICLKQVAQKVPQVFNTVSTPSSWVLDCK